MQKRALYFIAIVLPVDTAKVINMLKQEIAARFGSKHALKVIPHITLKAPFKLLEDGEGQLIKWFENLGLTVPSFEQQLQGFGAFNNARNPVIYVKPLLNEKLVNLQAQLIHYFKIQFPSIEIGEHEQHFNPHITIAYRDLTHHHFIEAWKEFEHRHLAAEFLVDSIHLLKHDGYHWNVIAERILPQD